MFVFNIPPTAKLVRSYGDWSHTLKSHRTDWYARDQTRNHWFTQGE